MGKGRTHITQPFEIKIDISSFMDVIKDKLIEAISESDKDLSDVFLEDWDLDGEYVEFKGTYRTGADTWYYRQTLEEPEDSGHEPDTQLNKRDIEMGFKDQMARFVILGMVDNALDVKNPIADLLRVAVVDDDYEPEWDDDDDEGPDPDRAYDEWRDRQFEEE